MTRLHLRTSPQLQQNDIHYMYATIRISVDKWHSDKFHFEQLVNNCHATFQTCSCFAAKFTITYSCPADAGLELWFSQCTRNMDN